MLLSGIGWHKISNFPLLRNSEFRNSVPIELPGAINAGNVNEFVGDVVWPAFLDERERLEVIAWWGRGHQPDYLVSPANAEKRALMRLSKTPWLGLVVSSFAQCLYVDGYRAEGEKINSPGPWRTWNANGLGSRQIAIHRAALTYGFSYARALLGTALDGADQAVLRGVSPRRMFALYVDSVADDFPRYALELLQDGSTARFYTDNEYFDLRVQGEDLFKEPPLVTYHGTGVVPVVRYCNQMDLDGRTVGEVEQYIPIASRIDKTDFDRMLAQHYNSWKVKTATGIDELDSESTDEDAANAKLTLANDDILMHGNPDAKFGTLPETSLDGFIAAHESDIETLASNAQLPSHLLTGKLVNLSAEALAAARANTTQKLYEKQVSFGASHNQLLRLAAHIEGDKAGAADFNASVSWQDTSVRSLAQAVDAYGKAAQMLGMPKQFLWGKVPGFDQSDVEAMEKHLLDSDPESVFLRMYGQNRNSDPSVSAGQSLGGVPGGDGGHVMGGVNG